MPDPAQDPSGGPVLRRKRVAMACDVCRAMRAKCDGAKPCERCKGYGYGCVYSASRRRTRAMECQESRDALVEVEEKLRLAVSQLEGLVRGATPGLSDAEQNDLADRMAAIHARVDGALSRLRLVDAIPSPATDTPSPRLRIPAHSQRYLGEVSDVRFFNLIERVLQDKNVATHVDEKMDSYEQDDPVLKDAPPPRVSIELPDPDTADEMLAIYFSTVHVAYPFIQKSNFMTTYKSIRAGGSVKNVESSWMALLYVLLAIGAYYTSSPGKDKNTLHEHYFWKATSLAYAEPIERSINQVSFLLAECFYLLAVCRTDRCWTALGLAVRVAQSIGLHVEAEDPMLLSGQALLKTEIRRRVWYSLYVLDRLLSLQLGRPPAVHDDDFNVLLPSRLDDEDIPWDSEEALLHDPEGSSKGDYFLSVIALSRIIGYVLRGVYGPRRETATAETSVNTRMLDKQLLDWKCGLPRSLRFDFGHAFETSLTFRRQRNMLAVKFHHLRALIHRPYLCLRLLRHPNDTSPVAGPAEYRLLDRFEKICVSEAQETAHLLHNVADEKELVRDFPWWQMISCLICASSILLVASVFARPGGASMSEELDVAALNDDSETCLKVFEALSANSDGARIARDMMTGLKERGLKWRDARPAPDADPLPHLAATGPTNAQRSQDPVLGFPPQYDISATAQFELGSDGVGAVFDSQEWPSEILDSMTWSAQFFGAVCNPPLSPFDPEG